MPTWSIRTGTGGREQPEYELLDTGIFNDNRYFDVCTEYAKADDRDLLIRITVTIVPCLDRGRKPPTCTCCRHSGFATAGRSDGWTANPTSGVGPMA